MFIRYVRHQVGDILMSSYPSVEREKIVSEMLTDKVTQDIIAAYPTYKLPKLQQLVIWFMKHNCQMALFILFKKFGRGGVYLCTCFGRKPKFE